jgi:hypothetical protein
MERLIHRFPTIPRFKEDLRSIATPLLVASSCFETYVEVVELPIDALPPVLSESDDDGETPLFVVCKVDPTEKVQLLLDRCSHALRMKNGIGEYPLHCASMHVF